MEMRNSPFMAVELDEESIEPDLALFELHPLELVTLHLVRYHLGSDVVAHSEAQAELL